MRLWSVHPKYLDRVGLIALWREALLAQKVLQGGTRGYRNHPQLDRFKKHRRPQHAIAGYLMGVWRESKKRGYHFNRRKIARRPSSIRIPVTQGQLEYEVTWLGRKLKRRDPERYRALRALEDVESHPLFSIVEGPAEAWEITPRARAKTGDPADGKAQSLALHDSSAAPRHFFLTARR